MGQFSWYTCDTVKPVYDNEEKTVYLLNPFGENIKETYYDGYGHFGKYDVYDLVAQWNREAMSYEELSQFYEKPKLENYGGLYPFEKDELKAEGKTDAEIEAIQIEKQKENYDRAMAWYEKDLKILKDYCNRMPNEDIIKKYDSIHFEREIGINIACYNKDNFRLVYPIKIASKDIPYETATPSMSDPNQGWHSTKKEIAENKEKYEKLLEEYYYDKDEIDIER